LFGSLSLTGKGHATDLAVMLGLTGADPEYIPIDSIDKTISEIKKNKQLHLAGERMIPFDMEADIVFNKTSCLSILTDLHLQPIRRMANMNRHSIQ